MRLNLRIAGRESNLEQAVLIKFVIEINFEIPSWNFTLKSKVKLLEVTDENALSVYKS